MGLKTGETRGALGEPKLFTAKAARSLLRLYTDKCRQPLPKFRSTIRVAPGSASLPYFEWPKIFLLSQRQRTPAEE
jgi:hypothetical protein